MSFEVDEAFVAIWWCLKLTRSSNFQDETTKHVFDRLIAWVILGILKKLWVITLWEQLRRSFLLHQLDDIFRRYFMTFRNRFRKSIVIGKKSTSKQARYSWVNLTLRTLVSLSVEIENEQSLALDKRHSDIESTSMNQCFANTTKIWMTINVNKADIYLFKCEHLSSYI